jgi:hypothetical protein
MISVDNTTYLHITILTLQSGVDPKNLLITMLSPKIRIMLKQEQQDYCHAYSITTGLRTIQNIYH